VNDMTESNEKVDGTVMQRPGKRERLVAAAAQLVHQNGVERTRLSDIAELADVPPGNVYYYFKTKEDVVEAVLQAQSREAATMLAAIGLRHRTPKARLKALVRELTSQSEIVATFGCPLGSLCSELDKYVETTLPVAEPMTIILDWAETQFASIGRRDARDLAVEMLAAYEGHALLANTLRDPAILSGAARRIDRWIESLDRDK
jgi:TetR/AcrR family transcriptional regulator, transcriptional repressor for nem operon